MGAIEEDKNKRPIEKQLGFCVRVKWVLIKYFTLLVYLVSMFYLLQIMFFNVIMLGIIIWGLLQLYTFLSNLQIKSYERSKTSPLTKYIESQNEEVYRKLGMELIAD